MKKNFLSIIILVLLIILLPNIVNAGLQSKPGNISTNTSLDELFEGCRKMEVDGGVLGLSESLNDDYTGKSENGIDAHMALNTEWGTIAMLTDSAYGIGKDIAGTNNTKTSTDNATGIYNLANGTGEWVAAIIEARGSAANQNLKKANQKYVNSYTSKKSIPGDAIDCKNWLSATQDYWTSEYPCLRKRV